MANFKDSQDQRKNIMKPVERSCNKKMPICHLKTNVYYLEVMTNDIFFKKGKKRSNVKM